MSVWQASWLQRCLEYHRLSLAADLSSSSLREYKIFQQSSTHRQLSNCVNTLQRVIFLHLVTKKETQHCVLLIVQQLIIYYYPPVITVCNKIQITNCIGYNLNTTKQYTYTEAVLRWSMGHSAQYFGQAYNSKYAVLKAYCSSSDGEIKHFTGYGYLVQAFHAAGGETVALTFPLIFTKMHPQRENVNFLLHIRSKKILKPEAFCDPKVRLRPGLCPGPRWGSSRRSTDPQSAGTGYLLPIPHSTRRLDPRPSIFGRAGTKYFLLKPSPHTHTHTHVYKHTTRSVCGRQLQSQPKIVQISSTTTTQSCNLTRNKTHSTSVSFMYTVQRQWRIQRYWREGANWGTQRGGASPEFFF